MCDRVLRCRQPGYRRSVLASERDRATPCPSRARPMRAGISANSVTRVSGSSAPERAVAARPGDRPGRRGRARPGVPVRRLRPPDPAHRAHRPDRAHPGPGPGSPAGPRSPAGPAGPASPAGPGSPAGPRSPAGPAGPGSPAGPAGPAGPTSPRHAHPPARLARRPRLARRTGLALQARGPREPRGPRSPAAGPRSGAAGAAVAAPGRAGPAGRGARGRTTPARRRTVPGGRRGAAGRAVAVRRLRGSRGVRGGVRHGAPRSGGAPCPTCTGPVSPVRSAKPTPATIRGSPGGWRTGRSPRSRTPDPAADVVKVGCVTGSPGRVLPRMPVFGLHCSHEQVHPSALLAAVQQAEAAGFDAAMSSDHFSPWSARQGHSAFAWSWLGAALQATSLPFGVVNAPGQRYHPAIIAQAIATLDRDVPGPVLGGAGHRRGQQRAHHRRPAGRARRCATPACASASTSSAPCCAARRSATTGWSASTAPRSTAGRPPHRRSSAPRSARPRPRGARSGPTG